MLHNLSPNQIFTLQNSQINTLKLFIASLLSVLNAFALKITATNQEHSQHRRWDEEYFKFSKRQVGSFRFMILALLSSCVVIE